MGKNKVKRGNAARITPGSDELADEQLATVGGGAGDGINSLVSVTQLKADAAAEQASDDSLKEDRKLNRSRWSR